MSIDLNIDHYTNEDLIVLLKLQPGYTGEQLEKNENEFYLQLMNTVSDIPTRSNITLFLKLAKERLSTLLYKTTLLFKVDSIYRSIYSKSYDFVHTMEPLLIESIQITHIDMPVYWNEYTNASFQWNQTTVYIPDGNYTSSEMETLIPSLVDLSCTIRPQTIFSSKEPFTIEFGKGFKTAGWNMGFRKEKYEGEYNLITSLYEMKAEAPYGNLTECLSIEVYDYQDKCITDITYENQSKYTLACIPVQNQQRLPPTIYPKRMYPSPIKVERLRIRLFDKFGEPFLLKTDFMITFLVKLK
jgi:hypothetical protein